MHFGDLQVLHRAVEQQYKMKAKDEDLNFNVLKPKPDGQQDRLTDMQTQTDIHTESNRARQTDSQTDCLTYRQTDIQTQTNNQAILIQEGSST